MRTYPDINTSLLAEAAASAGEFVWNKFPNLSQWVEGEKQPTVNQLADFAKAVHIPFGFFFLQSLPSVESKIPLFRSGSKQPVFNYSPELRNTINTIENRQDWLTDFLKTEQYEVLPFVGSVTVKNSVLDIADRIRKQLNLQKNWPQFVQDKAMALNYLIQKIESAGIYVAINGVVGNGQANLNPLEFKGFVLTNNYAPYIFINGKDFPAAKLFTIMHELGHIWLGKSAAFDLEKFLPADDIIEKKCDAVAAELLVAEANLIREWELVKNQANHLQQLERHFKVSPIVIARRLLDIGKYTKEQFFSFYQNYIKDWEIKKANNESGGGNFYNNQNYRVGKAFFNTVNEAAKSGKLLYSDAYKLTDLYGKTFHNYENTLL